jgi:hypothetical protein
MEKKYQVFVSSTYEDLQAERQEIMHALLELNCIPAGMELFPAADEDQWSLIKGVIDDCDYYIVISAGRYGSIGPEGISYTEMEHRYAIEQKKPMIAFLNKDPDSLPKNRTEGKEEGQKLLAQFRSRLQERMCKYWSSPQELGSVVSRSLIMLQRKHPGIGWVRGDLVPDREASVELLDLRKQIESLEKQLDAARTQAPPGTEHLAQGGDKFMIEYSASSKKTNFFDTHSWTGSVFVDWNEIFYTVSPLLIHEAADSEVRRAINGLVAREALPNLKRNSEAEGHSFSNFRVRDDSFHTIIVQLRALGLMTQSVKNKSVKDTATYWTLTPYGDSVMLNLRAMAKPVAMQNESVGRGATAKTSPKKAIKKTAKKP